MIEPRLATTGTGLTHFHEQFLADDGDGYLGGLPGCCDCDDANPNVYPNAIDDCHCEAGVDNECDGVPETIEDCKWVCNG
ncbi:MAG: putative metal-binding motif-containing protein [Myxococcota bacterium]